MIEIGLHGGGRMKVEADRVDVTSVTPAVLAYGLSHVSRFGGQAGAYSVAEHSVRMWDWAAAERQDKAILRAILLHDGPECLGEGDHQRNIKRLFGAGGLSTYADMAVTALWRRFIPAEREVTVWPWSLVHAQVKWYDEWVGTLEARAFGFPHGPVPDWVDVQFAPGTPWPADRAEREFLSRWETCE